MGRPKDFPNIYEDLLTKHKSKNTADKEYKECLILAKEQGLTKDARLDDISALPNSEKKRASSVPKSSAKKEKPDSSGGGPLLKKQRRVEPPTAAGGDVSSSVKELYERLVEAERLRAQAEKQRGDDLSKIAMMLASGKGGEIIPQSTPAAAGKSPSKRPEPDQRDEEQTSQQHNKQNSQPTTQNREARTKAKHDKHAGAAGGVSGSATKSKRGLM